MSKRLYNCIVFFVFLTYRLFSKKGKSFFESRRLNTFIPTFENSILFHCASLGEYEESKPLIESVHKEYPDIPIVVSFFSNSGYEHLKKKGHSNITYLPIDSFGGYDDFLEKLSPKLVYISKYEFWPGFFDALHNRNILIIHFNTMIERSNSIFRWPLRNFLSVFKKAAYFTANQESKDVLLANGFHNVISGMDLRMNRALQLPVEAPDYSSLRNSIMKPLIIFGSTWPADEKFIIPFIQTHLEFQYILAPHEIEVTHIMHICNQVPNTKLWTSGQFDSWQCMVIDSIGDLKYLYQFADIAYIGGGLHHKVHNFLEASAYLIPTVIGRNYSNMPIAYFMIQKGFTTSVSTYQEFEKVLLAKRFTQLDKDSLTGLFKKSEQTLHNILSATRNLLSEK